MAASKASSILSIGKYLLKINNSSSQSLAKSMTITRNFQVCLFEE